MIKLNHENGVVALITSIVVGLLLIVITTSAVALMGNELRQASDFDQSTKAYYAAESGVEDALAHLRNTGDFTDKSTCDPYNADDAEFTNIKSPSGGDSNVEYTCQIVSTSTNQLTSSQPLGADSRVSFDLTGIDPSFSQFNVAWNLPSAGDPSSWSNSDFARFGDNGPTGFPGSGSGNNDAATDWAGKMPAVMEVSVVSYPKSATFNASSVKQNIVVLRPNSSGVNSVNYQQGSAKTPIAIQCNRSNPSYSCQAAITGFDGVNFNYIVSLQPRYSQASYQVSAVTNGGSPLNIPGQMVIDVTAKAGDVFRRVQARIPLTSGTSDDFPYYVLLADEDICKLLEVTSGTATPENACFGQTP